MKWRLWLSHQNLGHKMWAVYFLLFIIPMGYLLCVIYQLTCQEGPPDASSVFFAVQSLKIGVPAAVVLSVLAFILMWRSLKSIRAITKSAYSFYREVYGGTTDLVDTRDEAHLISRYVSDMIEELRRKLSDVDHYARQLDDAHRKLMEMAINDGLTDMYNHKHIRHVLEAEMQRAERFARPLSIIMMDIDDFKAFNDSYGHLMGDRALRDISRLMKRTIRSVDIPARYGGEEFLIILPETSHDAAAALAERVRQAVADHPFETGQEKRTVGLSVSMGVSSRAEKTATSQTLIGAADERLYEAKRAGKNRVCA